MYILKVENGITTTIIGTTSTEEKAAEYCKNKKMVRQSLSDKCSTFPDDDDDAFILMLTPEEREMYDSVEWFYINPKWFYEKLKEVV
jgi:hypothetical protein